MKKSKLIIPAIAVVFAIATAFATANAETQTEEGYKHGECTELRSLDPNQVGCGQGNDVICTIDNVAAYATPEDCDQEINPIMRPE